MIGVLSVQAQTTVSDDTSASAKKLFYQEGGASYYANRFHGRRTANGERYHKNRLTAAHRTLPFNTKVKVTNKRTGKWVIVRINDRGPYSRFVIDLSYRAAKHLGLTRGVGHARVVIEEVQPDPIEEWPQVHIPEKQGTGLK